MVAGSIMISCENKKTDSATDTKKEEKTTTTDNTTSDPLPVTNDNTNTTTTTSGWSSSDENMFMRDCESTATPKVGAARANEYCNCMLQKIKGLYNSYTEADRGLANDEAAMDKLANECNTPQ